MAKITLRVWILIIALVFAFVAIAPWKYFDSGVEIKSVEKNSSFYEGGLRAGMIIKEINNVPIKNFQDYSTEIESIFISSEPVKMVVKTSSEELIFLAKDPSKLIVGELPGTNIKTGLDLSGGARALIKAENASITSEELDDLISITSERFNAFGLKDIVVKPVRDLSGQNFMMIEIAGATQTDLKELLENQGKFEAKIGNETIFVGGEKDITYVGASGQDAGIYSCETYQAQEVCQFRFVIYLSEEAAQRQADVTATLSLNLSTGGKYLEKPLDLYVDDVLVDSLSIGEDLKGRVTTQIQISGSGSGTTRQEALDESKKQMKKLQTILKTGSLPYKLEIVKLDTISPALGKEFTKNILYLGAIVFIIISGILFIRYRKIKLTAAVILTMFSEAFITIAIATFIQWNLDVAGIAGIIAGMGTGVNDQIVIIDESSTDSNKSKLKERIKRALFIIFGAFFTIIAAMIPLFWAGAGMLKGFALTTIIGVSVGILITRPAFAQIAEKIQEKE
jgi:preprotein translocase subunit SecD